MSLVVFEGIDGAGKTHMSRRLHHEFTDSVLVREPGGTALGEKIRDILLSSDDDLDGRAELLLFLASRAQITRQVIRPVLEAGRLVITDRFYPSSIVYQGYALNHLPPRRVTELCMIATDNLRPDATVLLTLSPEKAKERLRGVGKTRGLDRYERRGPDFFDRVAYGYQMYFADRREADNVILVDADRPDDVVFADIVATLRNRSIL